MEARMSRSVDIYRILSAKKDVFSEEEATIIAGALDQRDNLATKDDLGKLEKELKKDISDLRLGTKNDMHALETGFRKEMSALKDEVVDKIHQTDLTMIGFGFAILAAIFVTNLRVLDLIGKLWGAIPK
jgi:hypothetical protein